ncbi:phage tail protein [Metasolibacillus meyeri]|uniref:Phage tail protein n=1 Tax=Metasolibacillus meyeri TaxID=1071052 RepID=A0AAW9NMB8_9BACL|nr:phage tail protein [Metasolibacillus meyeri]MEC1178552.1 phage tail protein [Metasolibacillus meyeri]
MAQYGSIITRIGLAKLTNAQITQTKVALTHIAIGDGNGANYTPTQEQIALVKEVWRTPISDVRINPENNKQIIINAVIPVTVGGFMMREIGVFDDQNHLIAVGQYPEKYKPQLSEGVSEETVVRFIIETNNVDTVKLVVDPTIIIASRKYVDDTVTTHANDKNNPHAVTKAQVGLGSVENYSIATQAEAEVGTAADKYMTPLRTKQAIDKGTTSHANDKNNPHAVTKVQVGLGSVENYSIATQAEAEAGTAVDKYMTPQRTKQAIDKLAANSKLYVLGQNAMTEIDSPASYQDGVTTFRIEGYNWNGVNRYETLCEVVKTEIVAVQRIAIKSGNPIIYERIALDQYTWSGWHQVYVGLASLPTASDTNRGIVQLTSQTNSNSAVVAASASAVYTLNQNKVNINQGSSINVGNMVTWQNWSQGTSYHKDQMGFVRVWISLMRTTNGMFTYNFLTLPVGYRPSVEILTHFHHSRKGNMPLYIETGGAVRTTSPDFVDGDIVTAFVVFRA